MKLIDKSKLDEIIRDHNPRRTFPLGTLFRISLCKIECNSDYSGQYLINSHGVFKLSDEESKWMDKVLMIDRFSEITLSEIKEDDCLFDLDFFSGDLLVMDEDDDE